MSSSEVFDIEKFGNSTVNQLQLKIMSAFAADMIGITDETELAWYVARKVVSKLGFKDCVVYLCRDEPGYLRQVATIGEKNPVADVIINPLKIAVGNGVTGRVAQSRKAMIIDDLETCEFYIPDVELARSEVCVPIMCTDQVFGVIDSEDKRKNYFCQNHLEILSFVAALMAAKLELIQKNWNLFKKTGIYRKTSSVIG